jgi:2-dehydro-3-deoxyglucarate aldolase/4-hydroxy-2-oxoheptanedioate aldolase
MSDTYPPIRFCDHLRNRQPLVGVVVSIPSPETVEILAASGYDWFFIDLEHSAMNVQEGQSLLQAAGSIPCLVRIPSRDEPGIRKVLDAGAQGIIIPQVQTAEETEQFIQFAKFPPRGRRSVGLGRAQGYGLKFQEYIQKANDETVVVVQIEHRLAVDNVEAILDVPGLDALFVGPYDLSASYGKIGQVDDPEIQAAISTVLQACQTRKMAAGIFAPSANLAIEYIHRGFSLLSVSTDTLLLGRSASSDVSAIKQTLHVSSVP